VLGPGTVIAGKYRIERVLGRGGMGTVVEATHAQLGASFALKFLHDNVAGNAALAERFFREARAAAALKSEHVCRVFDVGEFEGAPYLVMERLVGTDLAKVLRRRGCLPVQETCDYVIQACVGLAEAHAAQIVHRDLKPGNLFLTARPDGTPLVKVLDFGIAKVPREGDHELTGTHTILGSPSYMSLEQLRSSKLVDARSDIWSLGVILFELVSGRRPFVGDGVADLALKIAMEPTPRLPDGPAALDEIIGRCVAREPAHRYPEVAGLAIALAPFASEIGRALAAGLGRASRLSDPSGGMGAPHAAEMDAPATVTTLSVGAMETVSLPGQRRARPRARMFGLVAGVIVGSAMIGIAASGGGDDDASATAPESSKLLGTPAEDAATPPPPPPMPVDASIYRPTISVDAPAPASEPAGSAAAPQPEPAPEPLPAPPPAVKKPVPRATPRSPPGLPSAADLSKSRI